MICKYYEYHKNSYTKKKKVYMIYINSNAPDDVASRTRSKLIVKACKESARLEKAQKRSQNIPSRNLESVGSSYKVVSIEYINS